jgi:regulator of replication initiation timing
VSEDLYTKHLYDLSLEEKVRQLERQSSYERLARLELSVENERLRAENEALQHRLFPSQGEGYANEVERQRAVIDQFQRITEKVTAERDAARAECSDLYPAIESLRDELKRAKALLDPDNEPEPPDLRPSVWPPPVMSEWLRGGAVNVSALTDEMRAWADSWQPDAVDGRDAEIERLRAECSDSIAAIHSLRDELRRAQALLDPDNEETVDIVAAGEQG